MPYRENAKIVKADCLANGVYEIWFETEHIAREAKAGQFISVYSNDGAKLLPRPISICRIDGDNLRIVYRVAGKGTEEFSKMSTGECLNIQGPLGNGYDMPADNKHVLLLGGGIGIPPMLELACEIVAQTTCTCDVVLGYRDTENFLKDEFESVDRDRCTVTVATEDGSVGTKGNVLDAVREHSIKADAIMACGPTPMLRAIKQYAAEHDIPCFISLEERMACGIGACLACVCKSVDKDEHSQVNNKRICKEGPVFDAREVEL